MDLSTKAQSIEKLKKLVYIDLDIILDILIDEGPGKYGQILREYEIKLLNKVEDLNKNLVDRNRYTEIVSGLQGAIHDLLDHPTKNNIIYFLYYASFQIEHEFSEVRSLFYKDDEEFHNTIWKSIEKTFKELGYEFHYFAVFNSKLDSVKVFLNKGYQLKPNIFEHGSTLSDMNIYEYGLDTIKKGGVSKPYVGKPVFTGIRSIGWKREDLRDAIEKTGLNVPKNTGNLKIYKNGEKKEIMKSPLAQMFGYSGTKLPGISTTLKMKNYSPNESIYPYMGKSYYEIIYRHLFNTLKYIDWNIVKQQKLLTIEQLQRTANEDFGVSIDVIKNYNYEQICDFLIQKSEMLRLENKD